MGNIITTLPELSTGNRSLNAVHDVDIDVNWSTLYRVGGIAGLVMLFMMPIQVILYILYPPPETAAGHLAAMRENPVIGFIGLDLLYMVTIVLAGLLVLAICVALRRADRSLVAIALFLTLVGTAVYFASTVAFEMLRLSNHYAAATTEAQRTIILAAGETMLATYQGSAFSISYVMAAIAGLILATVMLRGDLFDRKTAYAGFTMNVLALVPPTAGDVGLFLLFASLVPTIVWLVLVTRRLLQFGRSTGASLSG